MAEGKLGDPIGLPLDRVDGRLKVTGRATYAFEYAPQGSAAYGFIVVTIQPATSLNPAPIAIRMRLRLKT